MKQRALISVSDKTGIVDFCKELSALGFEILSTGGTHKALADAGIPVIGVSDVTGFPECLDGRVKTLHPNIHAGLLARRDNPDHMRQIEELSITPIDLVVINLYPFRATISKPGVTFEDAIENIDIGGPTMLRAAAKNWQDVAVITDPTDYAPVITELKEQKQVSRNTKFKLCTKVFSHTAQYDTLISSYLRDQGGEEFFPQNLSMTFEKVQEMRYGENPHQRAAFYRDLMEAPGSLASAEQLQGKELSYNNIGDTDGALDLLREFDEIAVIGVKHANPCGVGVADTVYGAWKKAYEADPVSIFGGIVVTNTIIDEQTAKEMSGIFLEIIAAPDYTPEALEAFKKKKNLRVLRLPQIGSAVNPGTIVAKKVYGGLIVQDCDNQLLPKEPAYTVVTDRQPTEEELDDLMLAWKIVKHTKSNGIAIAKDGASLGIGPGQVNRIWAAEQAIERSGEKVQGAAMGSDAFFPFPDCVEAAAKAGITAIIQPGGSLKDQDSIDACNKHGITMLFTGMRHFKH